MILSLIELGYNIVNFENRTKTKSDQPLNPKNEKYPQLISCISFFIFFWYK